MKKAFTVVLKGGEKGMLSGYIEVPFSVEKVFGTRARVPVRVTVNGFPFRSSMSPMGKGCHVIPVRRERCEAASVRAGQRVRVTVERDNAKRIVRAPQDLARSLSRNAKANAAWANLAYTHKKEFADWLRGAKQPETRARRLEKILASLTGRARAA